MEINLIKTNTDVKLEELNGKNKEEQAQIIIDELLLFSGHAAGKCYSKEPWLVLKGEDEELARKRIKFCINKMHHSVFEHPKLTFEMNKIPKFICMLLNNENVYTTSEQSARYTDFSEAGETEEERSLYTKWAEKLIPIITKEYGKKLKADQILKLAQENARYMISVFVPSSMIHTIDLRQLNYVIYYMEEFLKSDFNENAVQKKFYSMLEPRLKEFLEIMSIWKVDGLIPKTKVELSMFEPILAIQDDFDVTYNRTYPISFAAHAQNHRHRTIRYRMELLDKPTYYVPEIIKGTELEEEWLSDIKSVADVFPQGMQIKVNESGEVKDFIRKCFERCCGRAQYEIQEITNATLDLYREGCKNFKVQEYISKNVGSANSRCLFPKYSCVEVCAFGAKQRERKI